MALCSARVLLEVLDRSFDQSQALAQFDVLVREISGCGRQVVRVHRGERELAPILRGAELAVHLLEPFDGATQHLMRGQRRRDVVRHDAQILADDHAVGA